MIELVPPEDKHRDSLVKLLNNVNVERWLLQIPSPYTYEDADSWLKRCKENSEDEIDFAYVIENEGIHVGGIGLHKKFEHSAEVGYWIGEEYWGKGFATAALYKILHIGFNELNYSESMLTYLKEIQVQKKYF
ncbi:MAG: GNAT family N-acetyltransferase [Ignavibacteria bacterium]|nr:GNAT family N-acetyltransferase [Ignavibacteria bacterium]